MKLKNNKGYVGIDASIAILVLLIIVPTLAGMIYNVNKSNNLIDRKTEAISIAVNTIEAMKGIGIFDINDSNFNETVLTTSLSSLYTLDGNPTTEVVDNIKSIKGITLTKDKNTYQIQVDIQDYADTKEGKAKSVPLGKVKIVNVTVTFKSGKQTENIELSTVIS